MAPLWTSSTSKLKWSPVTSNNRSPTPSCIEEDRHRGARGGFAVTSCGHLQQCAVCGLWCAVWWLRGWSKERERAPTCAGQQDLVFSVRRPSDSPCRTWAPRQHVVGRAGPRSVSCQRAHTQHIGSRMVYPRWHSQYQPR